MSAGIIVFELSVIGNYPRGWIMGAHHPLIFTVWMLEKSAIPMPAALVVWRKDLQ